VVEGFPGRRFRAERAAASTCSSRARQRLLHQGRDAQPSDRDLALPGREHRRRRRDPRRGATGRGGKPKAGLTGFSVSHLRIPTLPQPWEQPRPLNPRMASAFEIMLDGPLGGAAFNNEFGRPEPHRLLPQLRAADRDAGPHARLRQADHARRRPGRDRPRARAKLPMRAGDAVVVLGGPAMLIGLGGGAARRWPPGQSSEALDFASVQRDNPEMERRCQEVIDRCAALGATTRSDSCTTSAPAACQRDPEAAARLRVGGVIDLAKIPPTILRSRRCSCGATSRRSATCSASAPESSAVFERVCARERCPYAVVGHATDEAAPAGGAACRHADAGRGGDRHADGPAVRQAAEDALATRAPGAGALAQARPGRLDLKEAGRRVLAHPPSPRRTSSSPSATAPSAACAARDQMVGALAAAAGRLRDHAHRLPRLAGEADGIGERTPLALLDAAAARAWRWARRSPTWPPRRSPRCRK
jgi:phosphoribosylformylglycinamidine synthase